MKRTILTILTALTALACQPAEGTLIGTGGSTSSQGGAAEGGAGGIGGGSPQGGMGGSPTGTPAGTATGTPTGSGGLPCAPVTTWDPTWETLENDLVALINARRQAGGMCGSQTMPPTGTVSSENVLRGVARAHVEDMVLDDYFAFAGLNGMSWIGQPDACGFGSPPTGQNIAAGQTTAQMVLDSLVSSESTCVNIHAAGDSIGVGYIEDANATFGSYWSFYIGQGS